MDEDTARQQAAEARDAFTHSSRPPLALVPSLVSALAAGVGVALFGAAGVGVALLGASNNGWVHAAAFVVGMLLVLAAGAFPNFLRKRAGLYGYRGQVQRDNQVFLIGAVALAVCGLNATATLSTIYVGIGAVVAITYFLVLRGRFGTPRW
jgi:hypothetical protein